MTLQAAAVHRRALPDVDSSNTGDRTGFGNNDRRMSAHDLPAARTATRVPNGAFSCRLRPFGNRGIIKLSDSAFSRSMWGSPNIRGGHSSSTCAPNVQSAITSTPTCPTVLWIAAFGRFLSAGSPRVSFGIRTAF